MLKVGKIKTVEMYRSVVDKNEDDIVEHLTLQRSAIMKRFIISENSNGDSKAIMSNIEIINTIPQFIPQFHTTTS